jgi:hypothetical protein
VLLRPKFDNEDDAKDAIDLIASCGQVLDPFQALLVCITLATLAGKLAASEVGGLIARQNGKGGWLEAVAIHSLFEPYLYGQLDGRKNTTLWTAHELKTSDEAWTRVKALIEANPDLAAEVVTWNGGLTGSHIIELRDGSRLIFLARSKSSGRGFSPRRIIFDEAQELSALAFRAMMYATSAQGSRRQLRMTRRSGPGSATGAGVRRCHVWLGPSGRQKGPTTLAPRLTRRTGRRAPRPTRHWVRGSSPRRSTRNGRRRRPTSKASCGSGCLCGPAADLGRSCSRSGQTAPAIRADQPPMA